MHVEHKLNHYIRTMASRQRSTRNKASPVDCEETLSTVCFERWQSRHAAINHAVLGTTAGTGRTRKNVVTCWEANMGFTARCDAIPPNFNDFDSWKEVVTPCCHCRTFQGDRPLKKKLRNFLSHHDAGLAEPYRCDTLWEVRPVAVPSTSSKKRSKQITVQVEENNVSSIPNRKKQKLAPSSDTVTPPALLPTAATPPATHEVIKKLEAKLLAKYKNDLAEHLREKAKVLATYALSKTKMEAKLALAEERRNLAEGRTQNTLRENAALKSENLSLVKKNAMVQADNTTVLREVLEEKQRIRKEVLALDAKMAHSGSLSYVQSLEDCTKNHCAKGTHRKYQAEKLATTAQAAYGGLCGTLLQGLCEDEIKKTNPYRDAMEVCRVLDMGSGQLNISGIDMLRKGIEGDERWKVEYGGGWLTSKYYLQQAQE